jgi:hypothetical protein
VSASSPRLAERRDRFCSVVSLAPEPTVANSFHLDERPCIVHQPTIMFAHHGGRRHARYTHAQTHTLTHARAHTRTRTRTHTHTHRYTPHTHTHRPGGPDQVVFALGCNVTDPAVEESLQEAVQVAADPLVGVVVLGLGLCGTNYPGEVGGPPCVCVFVCVRACVYVCVRVCVLCASVLVTVPAARPLFTLAPPTRRLYCNMAYRTPCVT